MAFQQAQQRPPAKAVPRPTTALETTARPSQQQQRPVEESQEWILFAPRSQTDFSSQTPRTTQASRISDFGSLETGVRSDQITQNREEDRAGRDAEDDEGDLDSLDDGLHAFNAPSPTHLDQSGGSVLPMHDGLGTFPSSYQYAANEGMQEQLWQHEKYNPHRRRHHRTRSSIHRRLEAINDEDELLDPTEERRLWIEKWRIEQSRAVVEEMEKEARRRRRRTDGRRTRGSIAETARTVPLSDSQSAAPRVEMGEETESFWQRITRRVIHDLIGLDETTLSVIFGEELPAEGLATPTQDSPLHERATETSVAAYPGRTWERRLLERIARELGILVDQLSGWEGAFSYYAAEDHTFDSTTEPARSSQIPIPFPAVSKGKQPVRRDMHLASSGSEVIFAPTLPRQTRTSATDASLWGIEEETIEQPDAQANHPAYDTDYWERDLSVRMIFSYLRKRFSPSAGPAIPDSPDTSLPSGPLPVSWQTTVASANNNTASALGTSPEALRRASLIRKHHPLVSRAAERADLRRRELARLTHQVSSSSASSSLPMLLKRRQSSCASQSTKRSRLSSAAAAAAGAAGGGAGSTSRNFWDFPGAAGSAGSVVSAGGPEGGAWGEV